MRKLDKTIRYAKKYEEWIQENPTASYNSSSSEYYLDVLFELLILQDGLCAYSEFRLIDEAELEKLKQSFTNGKSNIETWKEAFVNLEHFDASKKKAHGWAWDNLFAVWDSINYKKRGAESKTGIDSILKPDRIGYDPLKYLSYNAQEHIFFANINLKEAEKQKVNAMINTLGLNFGTLRTQREEYLKLQLAIAEFRDTAPILNQFFTAYQLMQA